MNKGLQASHTVRDRRREVTTQPTPGDLGVRDLTRRRFQRSSLRRLDSAGATRSTTARRPCPTTAVPRPTCIGGCRVNWPDSVRSGAGQPELRKDCEADPPLSAVDVHELQRVSDDDGHRASALACDRGGAGDQFSLRAGEVFAACARRRPRKAGRRRSSLSAISATARRAAERSYVSGSAGLTCFGQP